MSDTTHEAPERMWIDPDILPSEWHKQYHCDVEYVRIDLVEAAEQQGYASAMEAERKLHEDRIEGLEAKLDKAMKLIEYAIELGRWDLNPSLRDDLIDFSAELKGETDG